MDLLNGFRARGYQSSLAVGQKFGKDPDVFEIKEAGAASRWKRFWRSIQKYLVSSHHSRLAEVAGSLSRLREDIENQLGVENFNFPGSHHLLEQSPFQPNIVHAHNLHRDYFDLRTLPRLSRRAPFVITLHDAWLLSGHCAHSFDCERWRIGCGDCPDLNIYPSVRRDATRYNWIRKKNIYSRSQLFVSTPSDWLMNKVHASMLAPAIMDARVIPNGVDLSLFRPGNRSEIRRSIGVPENAFTILLTARAVLEDPWKDLDLTNSVLEALSARIRGAPNLVLAVGWKAPTRYVGRTEIRFIPRQEHSASLVKYFQAADVCFHPARVDTFPLFVLEALACGVPVVATAVGGIPEQVREGISGFLVAPGDSQAAVDALSRLSENARLRLTMSRNAAQDASRRFDRDRYIDEYLDWYHEIIARHARMAFRIGTDQLRDRKWKLAG